MLPSLNPYVLLGVLPSASIAEIERAFRNILRAHNGIEKDFFSEAYEEQAYQACLKLTTERKSDIFLRERDAYFVQFRRESEAFPQIVAVAIEIAMKKGKITEKMVVKKMALSPPITKRLLEEMERRGFKTRKDPV